MEENKEGMNPENKPEENGSDQKDPTFDELLKNPAYQAEFDKKVAKALEKSRSKWEAEAEAKKNEAEKLANMNAEQKNKYELDKVTGERDEARAELNSYKLKDEALKIAKEKGIDPSLLQFIDYKTATADSIKELFDQIGPTYQKAIEEGVNAKLRQNSPKEVKDGSTPKKEFSRASY